ncbi:hypothetical protein TNCV_4980811 [Trichonephila clavipes]|nr:hypothetical protein TNCV_4980811 [Trichonephila clavipes]
MFPQTSEEVFMREPAIAVENEIGFDLIAAPFFTSSLMEVYKNMQEIKLKETIPLPAFVSSGKIATDLPQMGLEEILYYHRHYSKSIDELTALENRTVQQNCMANSLKWATQEVNISFLWVNNVSTSAMSRQQVKSCHSSQSGRQDVESRNMAGSGLPSSSMTEITTARIGEMI